jgi:hypothetical protein
LFPDRNSRKVTSNLGEDMYAPVCSPSIHAVGSVVSVSTAPKSLVSSHNFIIQPTSGSTSNSNPFL